MKCGGTASTNGVMVNYVTPPVAVLSDVLCLLVEAVKRLEIHDYQSSLYGGVLNPNVKL